MTVMVCVAMHVHGDGGSVVWWCGGVVVVLFS